MISTLKGLHIKKNVPLLSYQFCHKTLTFNRGSDGSRLPTKVTPFSGEKEKELTPAVMQAADKACLANKMLLSDKIKVPLTYGGASLITQVSCSEAQNYVSTTKSSKV